MNAKEDVSKRATDICPVCDAVAPECAKKALHYGGICCYSCRAFFRRAHQHTKEPNFVCRTASHGYMSTYNDNGEGETSTSGQCGYDITTKRQCQFHRLKRCLEIGMDPDLVLTSSEKTVRFRKCLRKSNNCTKRISKHATPSTHSNVSQNVKDRLTKLLNPISKTEIMNSSPLEEDYTRIKPCSTSTMSEHQDQYSEKLHKRLKTVNHGQNRNYIQNDPIASSSHQMSERIILYQNMHSPVGDLQSHEKTSQQLDTLSPSYQQNQTTSYLKPSIQDKLSSCNHLSMIYGNTENKSYEDSDKNIESFTLSPQLSRSNKSKFIMQRRIVTGNRIDKQRNELDKRTLRNLAERCKNDDYINNLRNSISDIRHSSPEFTPTITDALEPVRMHAIDLSCDMYDRNKYLKKNRLINANCFQQPNTSDQNILYSKHLQRKKPVGDCNVYQSTTTFNPVSRNIHAKYEEISKCNESYTSTGILPKYNSLKMEDEPNSSFVGNCQNNHGLDPNRFNPVDQKYIKRQKLLKIDEIIDIFVPAMKQTQIRRDFAIKIVNLHMKESIKITDLNRVDATSPQSDIDELCLADLLTQFSSLIQSFVLFANNYPAFQVLCKEDQSELLKRNSFKFVMYLFSRYFSSDVALEQMSWLLKGSGISLPIGLVAYSDLGHLSDVKFDQFNKICRIVDPEEDNGSYYKKFSDCIETIRNEFPYPQYYNSLIGLLILFHNDESYELRDSSRINKISEETKELVLMGYEDFEGFGKNSLSMLISKLNDMCEISKDLIWKSPKGFTKKNEKQIVEDDCFVIINGIKAQTKPIDCSTTEATNDVLPHNQDLFLPKPMKILIDYPDRIKHAFESFEGAFSSVRSEYILTTMIDFAVGRIKKNDFPREYAKIHFMLSLERFKRCLDIYPEFKNHLSDYDRSLIWKRNHSIAAGLLACKMESATSGAEQFMFRAGQLREESNIFWGLEFKHYHGLKSVTDIPFVSVDTVACNRFNPTQLEQYYGLIKHLKPLMRDTILFHLISMIMLLDTSNLSDGYSNSNSQGQEEYQDLSKNNRASIVERFQDITVLQKYYANLFHNQCIERKTEELRCFGETEEEMNRTIANIKDLSYLISLLIK